MVVVRRSGGGGGGGAGRRRRRDGATSSSSSAAVGAKRSRKQQQLDFALDDDVLSDDDDDDDVDDDSEDDDDERMRGSGDDDDDEGEVERETVEDKRVRLAREYLEKVDAASTSSSGSSGDSSSSDEADDGEEKETGDKLGYKLQRDRLKRQGTLERALADKTASRIRSMRTAVSERINGNEATTSSSSSSEREAKAWSEANDDGSVYAKYLRGHDLTPTCVALQSDGTRALSGSKDHSVLLWDIEKSCRASTVCRHWKKGEHNGGGNSNGRKKGRNEQQQRTSGQVLSVACSDDGRYAAVGTKNALVRIFDIRIRSSSSSTSGSNGNLVKTFAGHKGAITSLAFRTQTLQLFSGSEDRCIRHYNLEEMMYIETLYGHQFGVTALDCYAKERPCSAGRDRTVRAWKLAEDTHLIFRGGGRVQSAEALSVVKDDWFLTGHEDGHVSLWMADKKRAVAVCDDAHGVVDGQGDVGRGVVSVGSVRGSDLAATGSNDGYLRFWKVMTGRTVGERGLERMEDCEIPVHGYINGIAMGPKAKFCVLAVGQEHRLGRWNRVPRAKNRLAIIRLGTTSDDQKSNDDDDDKDDQKETIDPPPPSGDSDENSRSSSSSSSASGSDE